MFTYRLNSCGVKYFIFIILTALPQVGTPNPTMIPVVGALANVGNVACPGGSNVYSSGQVGTVAVPAGCGHARIKAWGGGGGGSIDMSFDYSPKGGGAGAFVDATVPVSGTLYYEVANGGAGAKNSTGGRCNSAVPGTPGGGYGAGNDGGSYYCGGGGGGYSGVFISSASQANALVIAGGGGGGSGGGTGGSGGTGGGNGSHNGIAFNATGGTGNTSRGGGGGGYFGGAITTSPNRAHGGTNYIKAGSTTNSNTGGTSSTTSVGGASVGAADPDYVANLGKGGNGATGSTPLTAGSGSGGKIVIYWLP